MVGRLGFLDWAKIKSWSRLGIPSVKSFFSPVIPVVVKHVHRHFTSITKASTISITPIVVLRPHKTHRKAKDRTSFLAPPRLHLLPMPIDHTVYDNDPAVNQGITPADGLQVYNQVKDMLTRIQKGETVLLAATEDSNLTKSPTAHNTRNNTLTLSFRTSSVGWNESTQSINYASRYLETCPAAQEVREGRIERRSIRVWRWSVSQCSAGVAK